MKKLLQCLNTPENFENKMKDPADATWLGEKITLNNQKLFPYYIIKIANIFWT